MHNLAVVSFMLGNQRFAIEATQVRGMLTPQTSAEPAQPLALLLGLSVPGTPHSSRNLLIKHPAGDYPVTVAEPVCLLSLDKSAIRPLPPLIAACNHLAALRGLALAHDGLILLLDLSAVGHIIHSSA